MVGMNEGLGIDRLRLTEAAGTAAAVLGSTALPVAWPMLDASLAAVLAGMLALLTVGVYALHAVTFDCLRITSHRARQGFSYTQREE